jgi:hypothetical protein
MKPSQLPFKHTQHFLQAVLVSLILIGGMVNTSCTENSMTKTKASSALLAQVALRQQLQATPTVESNCL